MSQQGVCVGGECVWLGGRYGDEALIIEHFLRVNKADGDTC